MKISKLGLLELYLLLWIPIVIIYVWLLLTDDISYAIGSISGSGIVYAAIGIYYWKKGTFELPKKE
ncbi:MAG: hypothetical protein RBR05_01415 [Candidatus Methanomethylophilaceae archaeon]|nr:hypothetical protein [Candidatus Methanomethylophilaceae archaeon]